MIDLDVASLAEVKSILSKHLGNVEVRAFGSRVSGKAAKFSDLDLVIIGEQPISVQKLNELRLAFSDSDLPIMVDIIDWHTISEEFRTLILEGSEVLSGGAPLSN